MKNPNAIRPRAQELNESIRRPEDILGLKIERLMVEPKFDGSFVYITHDRVAGRTVLCTKDSNELQLDPAIQNFILRHFGPLTEHFIFEAELEPVPWSESNKVALNGNLYSRRELPFAIRLVIHDVLPMDELEKPVSSARQRYGLLRALARIEAGVQLVEPHVWDKNARVGICITPCQEMAREGAAELFRVGWEEGKKRRRVVLGGAPYEGLVLIDPESLHKGGRSNKWKVKPFHTVDIHVTELREGFSGKVPLFEVHGCDTKTGEVVKITSGISPAMFAQLRQVRDQYPTLIIEVEVSSLRELKSANPTIQAIRFDKIGSPKSELRVVVAA